MCVFLNQVTKIFHYSLEVVPPDFVQLMYVLEKHID